MFYRFLCKNISMVKKLLSQKIKELYPGIDFDVLIPPDEKFGDYSVNLAFGLAKKEKKNPVEVGERLVRQFSEDPELKEYFSKIELAPPGFINFFLSDDFLRRELAEIIEKGEEFGSSDSGKGVKINLEFISANPTGPLTVGNARSASFGDTLANIFKKAGYDIAKEYYINDTGNQVRLLGESVAWRYLRIKGKTIEFPDNFYQGEYIIEVAKQVAESGVADNIENFNELVEICKNYAVNEFIASAKKSIENLGVNFDIWFSEKSLQESGEVENTLQLLEKGQHVYEKDGAKWLSLNNDEGVVLVKSDGAYSYLMTDIAYTRNKFIRGFNKAINIWGADHHGDALRLKMGVKALGYEEDKLKILLHQLVFIRSKGELQRMSKRKGEFVLLDNLINEVGKDIIRFFFLMKDLNTHMEFDLDLAKEQSKKNPVYYIQYAYARLNSIFAKCKTKSVKRKTDKTDFRLLREEEELQLMRDMVKFPELVEEISKNYQVHHLARYTLGLASDFHNFYERHRVIQEDKKIKAARLQLARAVYIVLKSCLDLMGLSSPEKM